MMENWKDCKGWEGLYEVSDLGRVRSIKRVKKTHLGYRDYGGFIVNPFICTNGYMAVNFTDSNVREQVMIHRLVLTAFEGEPLNKHECCHYDGDRENNHLKNLRWDTRKNNHADKKRHGTDFRGSKNPFAKLTEQKVIEIRLARRHYTYKQIADIYGVSVGCIAKIMCRQSWRHVK